MVDVDKQVWARAMAQAPGAYQLQATYKHTSSPAFHQAVGACLLAAAHVVPDGLLLFTPSYSMLQKLQLAWQVLPAALQPMKGLQAFLQPSSRCHVALAGEHDKKARDLGLRLATHLLALLGCSRARASCAHHLLLLLLIGRGPTSR